MSDDDRAAVLMEEVGEVARACTPDARTEVGHAGELAAELIQVATMALTWTQAIINAQPADDAELATDLARHISTATSVLTVHPSTTDDTTN